MLCRGASVRVRHAPRARTAPPCALVHAHVCVHTRATTHHAAGLAVWVLCLGVCRCRFTCVLSTVRCGGWKHNWCIGVMGMIIDAFPRCGNLVCVAVKGGPATDDEILMFVDILAQLGFSCYEEAKPDGAGRW